MPKLSYKFHESTHCSDRCSLQRSQNLNAGELEGEEESRGREGMKY
jgi:hypothetical protein